ncbi:MAG: ABC transporter ATP-binding protein [Culicoidibacterales bacterium]
MKIMGKYLTGYRLLFMISISCVIVSASAMLAQPRLLQTIINEGIAAQAGPDQTIIQQYGLILIGVGLLGLIAGIINTILGAKISLGMGAAIREDAFKKIQTFSFTNIETFSTSNLVVRLTNDINQIQMFVMMTVQSLFQIPILFIGSFVLAMQALPELWWIIVLLIVSVLVLLALALVRAIPFFKRLQTSLDKVNTVIKENFEGVRVVKSFVQEQHEIERFEVNSNQLAKTTISIGHIFSTVIPTFMLLANLAVGSAIYFASELAVVDPLVIGEVVSFTSYLFQIMMALIIGGTLLITVSRAMVSMRRIQEIFTTESEITYQAGPDLKLVGDVCFENVSFTYAGDETPTLKSVSFAVKAGEFVGIVGATGSGKTTLVQLLARLYEANEGKIKIGGIDLTQIPKQSLRQSVAIVLQQALLFSGTVSQNIRHGKFDATVAEMEYAAGISQAREFIERLEARYDSEVYQRGSNFSGGQKQRLSITRGVVGEPSVLILDDSTSALDARSEKLVKQALDRELSETTLFVVAQKISSVIQADKIIVLDQGRIDAIGTHAELLETSLIYQEIYATQKGIGADGDEN